jgi:hypothetical protein
MRIAFKGNGLAGSTEKSPRMAGFIASHKDRLCNELLATYQYLCACVESRRDYAESWTRLGNSICAMGSEQVPEVQQSFRDLRALFEEISQIHMTLALAEDRTAEDWRDVIERYSVVFRVNDAHNEQKFLFDSETQSLAETQR